MTRYWRGYTASLAHALSTFSRRRRTHVVCMLVLLPALLPLLIPFLPHEGDHEISRDLILTRMIELFYVTGVTPLLALFFAAMLVGEDVESQTISYVLTRPVARSAWVLGRFAAYLLIGSGLILAAIVTLRLTLLTMPAPEDPEVGIGTLLQYEAVAIMSLLAYGALCTFLGSRFRHPVVIGALLIFGVQHVAMIAPGLADFLTIQKYVDTLLPASKATPIQVARELASEFMAPDVPVTRRNAFVILLGISAVCLSLAGLTVRSREYTTPVAVTE